MAEIDREGQCTVEGCNDKIHAKGLCKKHYTRLLKHGNVNVLKQMRDGRVKDNRYKVYVGMIDRCYNPNSKDYKNYGGRGIKISQRWIEPGGKGFINFCEDMGKRPSLNYSIDRILNNGDYETGNCRWADIYVQSGNKRTNNENVGVSHAEKRNHWIGYINYEGKRIEATFQTENEAVAFRKGLRLMIDKIAEKEKAARIDEIGVLRDAMILQSFSSNPKDYLDSHFTNMKYAEERIAELQNEREGKRES